MNKNIKIDISGGAFSTLLAIVFIVLKLTGVIDWSWLWVLAPIWMPLGLALIILVLVLIYFKKRKWRY